MSKHAKQEDAPEGGDGGEGAAGEEADEEPAAAEEGEKKKKKKKHKRKHDDEEAAEGEGGDETAKPKKRSGFQKTCQVRGAARARMHAATGVWLTCPSAQLSAALGSFLGVDQLSRPQVVKRLWEVSDLCAHAPGEQSRVGTARPDRSPSVAMRSTLESTSCRTRRISGCVRACLRVCRCLRSAMAHTGCTLACGACCMWQEILLDEKLQAVFKRKTMTMFNMNKFLTSHVKPLGDIKVEEEEAADEGEDGSEAEEKETKKPAKSKRS